LPFITVGIFARERDSGVQKLNHLAPWSLVEDLISKFLTYAITWLLVFSLPLSTFLIWKIGGGHIHATEVFNLCLGHFLYGLVVFGISFFATSITESGATAAIIVLAFTFGSWVFDFLSPSQTGWLLELTKLSLTAQIHSFELGLFDIGVTMKILVLASTFLGIGLIVSQKAIALKRKMLASITVAFACIFITTFITREKYSFDVTEDQRHSFAPSAESALKSLKSKLVLHIALSADDSRFKDFSRSILRPLIRAVPDLAYDFDQKNLSFNALTPSGSDSYGIVTYSYAGLSDQSRSTSPEEALPIIFKLANIKIAETSEVLYPGYPLELETGVPRAIYYGLIPFLILVTFIFIQRETFLEVIGYEK
jgi:hypothetical protein